MTSVDTTSAPVAATSAATFEEKFALMRSVGEECISEDDLKNLLQKKPNIRCYDGFEPSGRMHIAQGIFKAINVNKCTSCGCEFVFWVADWFALMNDKMGGEIEKIRIVGKYLLEVWRAAGMDMRNVTFLWSSDEINKHAEAYWKIVIDIGRRNSIARAKKCCTIMGKTEGSLSAAQILYPLMQCADIFFLKADVCQLGLDQRKVNMLAREYCDLIGRKLKPVILSHHMLAGLKKGQAKMSKSDPDSAIFMEDSAEDVARKIRAAHCPRVAQVAGEVADDGLGAGSDDKNPVLDYVEFVIFSVPGAVFTIPSGEVFTSYSLLEGAFLGGAVSEDELKEGLIQAINRLLDPVREHFTTNSEAKALLELVKSFRNAGPVKLAEAPAYAPEGQRLVAWMPAQIKLPLNVALVLVREVNAFIAAGGAASIVLPDWSAVARDEVTGEEKFVVATLQFNLDLLKAFGLSPQVEVVQQGQLILRNSDGYWVNAINVGRKLSLADIEPALNGEITNAGSVIGCLMRVADAVTLRASHVFSTPSDMQQGQLVSQFTGKAVVNVPFPSTEAVPSLCDPKASVSTADDILFADDNEMDLKRKIKKAYCAPGEAANSIVDIASWWIQTHGPLSVSRPEANGGPIQYSAAEQLLQDFTAQSLHPGDLKASVTSVLLEVTKNARAFVASAEGKKLSQLLRQAEKNALKKK